jgi:hypothetical protein
MRAPRVGPAGGSVVALALACTVGWLTGCGGGEDGAADTTKVEVVRTATPGPEPVERKTRVRITRPKPGTLVRGARPTGGGFAATVRVAGRAAPDTTVLLDGGCFRTGCNSTARAGDDGRWRGRVLVRGTARRTEARISVLTPVSDPLDVVRVRLEVPEPTPEPATPVRAAEPEAEPTAQPAQARPAVRPRRLVLVGDSLAVGIRRLLPGALPGWSVSVDARTGRRLAEGMGIVAAADVSSVPTVLAVSLFTNDDPGSVAALEQAVRDTVSRVGVRGCAVWATIVRPPLNGVSYGAANARLQALAAELGGRLVLVPWAATVARDPSLMGPDGVHPTPSGYQARAQLYAQAAQSCGG